LVENKKERSRLVQYEVAFHSLVKLLVKLLKAIIVSSVFDLVQQDYLVTLYTEVYIFIRLFICLMK